MTVIACNRKEMAGDSLATADRDHWFTRKLTRLDDGSICGIAGTGGEPIVEWLKRGGRRGDEPDYRNGDFYVLHLMHDGIYLYCNSLIPEKLKDKNFAIGSGGSLAMYAMRKLKKTPLQACKIAIESSIFCGGEVDVMQLQ